MKNPYLDALRRKKFEQMQVTPEVDMEQMEQDANNGDGAPMVLEGEMAEAPELAALGEMQGGYPIQDADVDQFIQNAEATPGLEPVTAEQVFGTDVIPEGKPKSIKDRVLQGLKGRK